MSKANVRLEQRNAEIRGMRLEITVLEARPADCTPARTTDACPDISTSTPTHDAGPKPSAVRGR
ncbi:hypothetical protein [Streptomyces sp. CC219B]|uniref:hypothetical protein n=1 Tax=Streptomyces sp. CC219B TaxID=3044574 RepID=UPI0024A86DF4|nr:hypothetical protein [Streptomyces sp. CC219B]